MKSPQLIVPQQAKQLIERWVRLDREHQDARALVNDKLAARDGSLPLELIEEMCRLQLKASEALETAVIEYKREREVAANEGIK